ncbi:MAG: DinB family protein [Phycisphaeraceae bacterium]
MTDTHARIREDVIELLTGGGAHLDFDRAVAELPAKLRGGKPEGQPHTPWRLVEHMRLAQHDIVAFVVDADHVSPPWPEGYWPEGDAPPSATAWQQSLAGFRRDAKRIQKLVADPKTDLLTPLPHGDGQTILREAMLIADHNAYHLGQLVVVRRLLGAWDE